MLVVGCLKILYLNSVIILEMHAEALDEFAYNYLRSLVTKFTTLVRGNTVTIVYQNGIKLDFIEAPVNCFLQMFFVTKVKAHILYLLLQTIGELILLNQNQTIINNRVGVAFYFSDTLVYCHKKLSSNFFIQI